jgi:hypothetical protein
LRSLEGRLGVFPSPALPGAGSTGLPRSRATLSAFALKLAQRLVGSPVID